MINLEAPQASLKRLLAALKPQSLEALCDHLKLPLKKNEYESVVRERLFERLTDPKLIHRRAKNFNEREKEIIISALLGSGILHEAEMDPSYAELSDREKRRIHEDFKSLRLKGLLFAVSETGYDQKSDGRAAYVLPNEIRRLLNDILLPKWVKEKLSAHPKVSTPRSCEDAFWPNLNLLVTDLVRGELRVKSDGKFFKKDFERLKSQMRLGMIPNAEAFAVMMERREYEFDLTALVTELALTGIVDFGIARVKSGKMTVYEDRLRDWTDMSPYLHGRLLVRHLFTTGPYSRPLCYKNIMKLAMCAPDDRILRVERLLEALMKRHRDVYGYYGRYTADYLEKEILLSIIVLYLTGLIHLWLDEKSRIRGVCVTTYGRNVLEKNREAFDDHRNEDVRPLFVQANYEGYLPAGSRFEIRIKLNEIAEIISVNKTIHFRITAESIYRARQTGMETADILKFLQDHSSKPIPQNVEYSIRQWGSKFGEVTFIEAMAVKCQSRELARELAHSQKFNSFVLGMLDERTVSVRADKVSEMTNLLIARGYMPDKVVHKGFPRAWAARDEGLGQEAAQQAAEEPQAVPDEEQRRAYASFKQAIVMADKGRNQLPAFEIKQFKWEGDNGDLRVKPDPAEGVPEKKPRPKSDAAPRPKRENGGNGRKPIRKWLEIRGVLDPAEKAELFAKVMEREGLVEFDYARGERGKVERQRVAPMKIYDGEGGKYVEGHEEMMGETQSYAIEKILKVQRYTK